MSRHITIRLEGLLFSYRFDERDLENELSKFGKIKEVMLLDEELAPDIAIVEFDKPDYAHAAVTALDGSDRRIEGYEGVTMRVSLMTPEVERELLVRAHILANSNEEVIDPFDFNRSSKYVCRYLLGSEKIHSEYSVIGRLVGVGGENVKAIHKQTGCYVKINGKARSVEDPLNVRISADSMESFTAGRVLTEALIADMYDDYEKWCERHYLPIAPVRLVVVEGSDTLRPLGRILL